MRLASSIIFVLALSLTSLANAAVSQAPDLNLPTKSGEMHLNDFKGRVVYLDFWASWCKPCVKSFPWMQTLQDKYRDQGLEVIAINLDSERALAESFLKKMNVDFIVAFDQIGDSAKDYQLKGMPTSYLIDRDGNLVATHIGFRTKDKPKLEQAVQLLLSDIKTQ